MAKITVSSFQHTHYESDRTPTEARLLWSANWTNEEGQSIAGETNLENPEHYRSVSASLSDGVVTIDEFEDVDCNVVDSVYNGIPATLALYDDDGYIETVYNNLKISDLVTPPTWAEIKRYSDSKRFHYSVTVATLEQLYQHVAQYSSTSVKANLSTIGVTELSATPADITHPIAVGDNDLRLVDNLVNYGGSLASAISSIGSAERVLVINSNVAVSTDTTIPTNITVKLGSRGKFTVSATKTLTVGSMEEAGNRQVFDVSASTAKVLFSRNAVEKINIAWYCGTANGTDATKAINQALESCENNDGGTIYFPEARYISTGGHIVPKATTLEGSGNFITIGYGGTNIKLSSPTDTYLFKIGDTTYDTAFTNLALDGTGTTSKDGILMEGTAPNSSGGCVIEKVVFYGFENGINYNTLSVGTTWQMAQVAVRDSKFLACAVGIRQTSVNSSWAIDNTNFYVPEDGWGLVLENGGICGFRNCEFAGNSNPNAGGIQVNGAHVALNFHGCQEEGTVCFLENNASDISGIFNFYGCLIQSKIQLNASCVINSHGSNYLSKVFKFGGIGTVCHITSIGDHVQERDVADGVTVVSPPVLTEGGTNNVHIVSEENAILESFAKRLPMRFVSPVTAVGNPTTPVLTLGHYTGGADEDKVLLRLGRLDADEVPDFYYDIYRDYMTGLLNFRGNQDLAYRGYKFDAAVFGLDEAYNAVDWNGNFSFPTKNAIRDKIESLGSGNVATDTIFDAKGDLVAGTGSNTAARLAVGTDGQFLKANSAQSTGLEWANISGGGDMLAANNLSDVANAATARTNLGLAIGTNVQAYDADLDTWATKTPPTGAVVGISDTQTLTNKTLTSPVINTPTADIITSLTAETVIANGDYIMIYDVSASALRKMLKSDFVSGLGGGGIGGTLGSTDNVVPRADGTGGATLQTSGVSITDSNNINTSNADGKILFGSSSPDTSTSTSPDASGIYSRDTHNNLDLVAYSGTVGARFRIAAGAQYFEFYPTNGNVVAQVDATAVSSSDATNTAWLLRSNGSLKRVKTDTAAGGKQFLYVDA